MSQPIDPPNLLDPASIADPYPAYRLLRERAPVCWSPHANCWLITRYEDVAAALQSPALSSKKAGGYLAGVPLSADEQASLERILPYFKLFMLGMDPPEHGRQRGLVSPAFAPRMIEGLRGRIEALVAELLDRAARRGGPLELIGDLAFPLPATVIMELLGIPPAGRPRMRASTETLAAFLGLAAPQPGQLRHMAETLAAMEDYLRPLIAARRAEPQDDVLSALATAGGEDSPLSEQEIIVTCTFLLGAGHETTTNLIGNGVLSLLRHPGELERLRREPALLPAAVEELLRFESSLQFIGRLTREDVVLGGARIPAGAFVRLGLGSANRDPEAFAEPDRLDVGRFSQPGQPRLLSFGHGPHFCLGAALARLQAQAAISALLERFPHLTLAEPAPRWRQNYVVRGLEALPVTV
ncbi:MAG TPA: cytochrome P450 [Herpetosiphonaceae bacterium]